MLSSGEIPLPASFDSLPLRRILFRAVRASAVVGGNHLVTQLIKQAKPGRTYILGGTVVSEQHQGSLLMFRVRDPKLDESVPIQYRGLVPDPFAIGRGVLVTVLKSGTASTLTVVNQILDILPQIKNLIDNTQR